MQYQRLMRSRTETVLSGVCGGLGEYFGVDPVIVRLIFVLVTLTTGLGVIVYPALWIAMPKAPVLPSAPIGDPAQPLLDVEPWVVQREHESVVVGQARAANPPRYGEAAPPPSAYNFDPLTGQALRPDATVGQTTQLPASTTTPVRPRRTGRWVALGLIAFGALILADQIGLNTDIVFPVIMILVGVFLLRRK